MPSLSWISAGAGAIGSLVLSLLIGSVYVGHLDRVHAKALDNQKTTLEQKCADDKKLTEESNNAYRKNNDDLADKLASYKQLHPARCIVPTSRASGVSAGKAASGEHAGQDGVSSDTLLDYAGECEHLRLQVISMQEFMDGVWK